MDSSNQLSASFHIPTNRLYDETGRTSQMFENESKSTDFDKIIRPKKTKSTHNEKLLNRTSFDEKEFLKIKDIFKQKQFNKESMKHNRS